MRYPAAAPRGRKGFTLVELSVVIVIVGVLAAFGVRRLLKSVERSKAAEAFSYLSAVRSAQERYQARQGTYADDIAKLDFELSTPKYFDVSSIDLGGKENQWSLTLTRKVGSSGYGQYKVVFTQDGFDAANSTIPDDVNPMGT